MGCDAHSSDIHAAGAAPPNAWGSGRYDALMFMGQPGSFLFTFGSPPGASDFPLEFSGLTAITTGEVVVNTVCADTASAYTTPQDIKSGKAMTA